jgi:hypothetical protein
LAVREVDPLRVLLYEDGLALLAAERWSSDEAQRTNTHVHLTNAASVSAMASVSERVISRAACRRRQRGVGRRG